MQTGFALTAFLALFLNLFIPEEIEDEETPELTANEVDGEADVQEWNRIRKSVDVGPGAGSSDGAVDVERKI
jgi:hypothetical protein